MNQMKTFQDVLNTITKHQINVYKFVKTKKVQGGFILLRGSVFLKTDKYFLLWSFSGPIVPHCFNIPYFFPHIFDEKFMVGKNIQRELWH